MPSNLILNFLNTSRGFRLRGCLMLWLQKKWVYGDDAGIEASREDPATGSSSIQFILTRFDTSFDTDKRKFQIERCDPLSYGFTAHCLQTIGY